MTVTDQLVKKVILSVDILAQKIHAKLEKSVRQGVGEGDQEAASPFAGIIQIKFERYDLRTNSSLADRVSARECQGFPGRYDG